MSESFYELASSTGDADEQLADTLNEIANLFGVDALDWIRAELERQVPVLHVTAWWQRLLGRLGIRTRALCGERIVARMVPGPMQTCRECQPALDGER
jgi:hypothetical protein